MKNLFFVTVILISAFFNACQDSLITDPISTKPIEKTVIPLMDMANTIRLGEVLLDPRAGITQAYSISGTVDYGLSYNSTYSGNIDPAFNLTIKLKIKALLEPNGNWDQTHYLVSGESVEHLLLPAVGSRETLLKKLYHINGMDSRMLLSCVFTVTRNSVDLTNVKLIFQSSNQYFPITYSE